MTVGELIKILEKYPKNKVVQVGATYAWEYAQGNITDIEDNRPRYEDQNKTCLLLVGDSNKETGWY